MVKPNLSILCVCSNCGHKNTICRSKKGCYSASGPTNCNDDNKCFGCVHNQTKCDSINMKCCQVGNFCNVNYQLDNRFNKNIYIAYFVMVVTVLAVSYFICCILKKLYTNHKMKWMDKERLGEIKAKLKRSTINARLATVEITNNCRDIPVQSRSDLQTFESTSTGTGPSELIQRTVGRDIRVDYSHGPLGQGRYGSVYPAQWHDDTVAVKLFSPMNEHSWRRETQVYQSPMLRHENILGFIAADIKSTGLSSVSMILVTEYQLHGSLFDYLKTNTVSKDNLFRFLYSICNGLNHMHQEIIGCTDYKPSIAHRDLKSKNILIKSNMECCLADFGLSVRYNSQLNNMDPVTRVREGSVRYMAPECLSGELNAGSIEELRMADVYGYALVVWECLWRVDLGKCQNDSNWEHALPYFEYVVGDVEWEVMWKIVCLEGIRPKLWLEEKLEDGYEDLKQLIDLMQECWIANPRGRLNTLAIKKKLKKIWSSDKTI